jgi:transcriptional regulator with XRE-family HTH domain
VTRRVAGPIAADDDPLEDQPGARPTRRNCSASAMWPTPTAGVASVRDGRDLDVQVQSVQEGPRDPPLVRAHHGGRASARAVPPHSAHRHPCVAFVPLTLRARVPTPGYPRILSHVGDHIRRRRLDLGISQYEAADRLGVEKSTVHNWEVKGTPPSTRYIPAVVSFLAYNPWPSPCGTLPERLRATRILRGLSQRATAEAIGVDKHTVWGWEKGRRKICGPYVERVERFLLPSRGSADICVAAAADRVMAIQRTVPLGRKKSV